MHAAAPPAEEACQPCAPVHRPRCSMKGIPQLQAAMARLMERFFLPGHTVDPQHVCISSGEQSLRPQPSGTHCT